MNRKITFFTLGGKFGGFGVKGFALDADPIATSLIKRSVIANPPIPFQQRRNMSRRVRWMSVHILKLIRIDQNPAKCTETVGVGLNEHPRPISLVAIGHPGECDTEGEINLSAQIA